MKKVRDRLFQLCYDYVELRRQSAMVAMEQAQDAANMEEKSSAGDKYETGRAMAHLEKEKATMQVLEANKMKVALDRIAQTKPSIEIGLGSVVKTDHGKFYLAIGAGKLIVDSEEYLALSPAAPLGALFIKKRVGDQIVFQNQKFNIEAIE